MKGEEIYWREGGRRMSRRKKIIIYKSKKYKRTENTCHVPYLIVHIIKEPIIYSTIYACACGIVCVYLRTNLYTLEIK